MCNFEKFCEKLGVHLPCGSACILLFLRLQTLEVVISAWGSAREGGWNELAISLETEEEARTQVFVFDLSPAVQKFGVRTYPVNLHFAAVRDEGSGVDDAFTLLGETLE